MSKVLDQFSEKHGDKFEVQIVNVREYPDVARLYQVRYVPTLVFLDEAGKMLDKRVGYMPLDALEKHWEGLGYDMKEGN
ncbi:MAG TPA: thioredoxin family protein [Aminivibrio sp.]|jgi:thioredoxin-related protein|uniref:thioredoxin family protein n=1 Tax=Aminivibrio sp. TaxID=1872489 RepID=UPI002B1EFCDC|nr:thioredoxin family protein [Aminivibrio sp.]MDD3515917.1 thioredoxin family protein [Synergistaceae bacterium]NCB17375.1 thioredoxin [Synergistales bacterium]MEA4952435.1 thioredoxin family protein [Aminivibrio sp.]HPF85823.1 thioredoxin family protein [Aminivibrio sp.]HRX26249.1 thioredoxin family protein [Aminivibrio sp.]